MRLTFPFLVSVLVVAGLTGCSALPGQGPSASSVVDESSARPSDQHDGYLVTELDPRVSAIVANKGDPSFRGRFGDYRPAPTPVIGVGDSVAVTIWEAAAGGLFSTPISATGSPGSHTAMIPEQIVARDGSITVPYAGRIKVAGLAPPAIEAKIVSALAGKAIEPQALVTVSRNLSNTATVTGEVATGARVPLSPRGDKVLEVIATAGGIRAPVHETFVKLSRDGHTASLPMQILLDHPEENVFVRPGDTLTLVRDPQTFTAFGATGRNSVVTFDARGITLEEAVAKAGGLLDYQSDAAGVFLLRSEPAAIARKLDPNFPVAPGQTTVPVVYRINLKDTNTFFLARKFAIQNKDMIYVANAPLTDIQKFLGLVQTVAAPVSTAKALSY